ncbi:taste receptor type 2 member 7-like [Ambystoma mexicanum]|uniref:taste receptor type 2 member 7-like n=1 Tax=Ambystoma mexicanum TaxID=8296 RepID=UPI0037E9AE7A
MSADQIFLLFHLVMSLFMGIATNVFIITVPCVAWAGNGHLASRDLLLLAHAASNIALQCSMSLEQMFVSFWREVYTPGFQIYFFTIFPAFAFYNLLTTSWLCVFYCAKIANFSQPLFMRLKLRISGMVPWLLLGSLLPSVGVSVPVPWALDKINEENVTSAQCNLTFWSYNYSLVYQISTEGVLFCFPLIVTVTSAGLILASLYRHTRRMQRTPSGFSQGPSVEAHKRAARTIFSLLILNLCFHITLLLMVSGVLRCEMVLLDIFETLLLFYPTMHGITLILGNPKLKGAAARVLCFRRHV